jgi:hydroxymethylglutaryl-CoA synthase
MSGQSTGLPGIGAVAAYLPRYRLNAEEIARTRRRKPGRPQERRLAGFDEDSLTLAIEAGQQLDGATDSATSLAFCSTTPPYLLKNNASTAHAVLGLAEAVPAFDLGSAQRSVVGAIMTAGPGTLVLAGDVATLRPGAPAELRYGDAGAALLTAAAEDSIATLIDVESLTEEMLDVWRLPESPWLQASEERFPVGGHMAMLDRVLDRLFARVERESIDHVLVSAPSARVATAAAKSIGAIAPVRALSGVGFCGSADLIVQLTDALVELEPGQTVLAVSLADGCDAIVLRGTALLPSRRPAPLRAADDGETPAYLDALNWRGLLGVEPPRRPEPAPVSPPAAMRGVGWKFGLHGAACRNCGAVSTPPQEVCVRCGSTDSDPVDLTRRGATIRTFAVDRLAYSPNPPLVAAIVDFDGGGRLEVELTDCAPESLAVGQRMQMTFRRRHSSGGIHNYGWKAMPEEGSHAK